MPNIDEQIELKELTRKQRRVLGVLLEKAFTTPEQYPLTLKSTTTGCNQKSNREPTTSYDEDDVAATLESLREIGLVAVIHTESGRTERFRHYMRHRTSFTEPQLAILTELMLRGRQQLGELRSRASRMVPIDSLEALRDALEPLLKQGLVRTNGPLERRGIEIDHGLYVAGEKHDGFSALPAESAPVGAAATHEPSYSHSPSHSHGQSHATGSTTAAVRNSVDAAGSENLASRIDELETKQQELIDQMFEMQEQFQRVVERFEDLKRQLGG